MCGIKSYFGSEPTIKPLVRDRIKSPIQLPHCDGLGIYNGEHHLQNKTFQMQSLVYHPLSYTKSSTFKITHLVFLHQSLVMHHSQGLRQDLEGRGLPSEGIPHNHQTVTHQDHVIDLKTNQNPTTYLPNMKTNFLNTFLYQFEDFQNEQNQEDFSGVFL